MDAEPLRVVTPLGIVRGVYGRIFLSEEDPIQHRVIVAMADRNGTVREGSEQGWTLQEVRNAVAVLRQVENELARREHDPR